MKLMSEKLHTHKFICIHINADCLQDATEAESWGEWREEKSKRGKWCRKL